MQRFPAISRLPDFSPRPPGKRLGLRLNRAGWFPAACLPLVWLVWLYATPVSAVILWNDPGTTLVHDNGAGTDILGGAVKRDDSAGDILYFKFHVDPLSDKDTEEYFAAFELYEGDAERLAVGNSLKAWAYSAFFHTDQAGDSNNADSYIDLHTARPEAPAADSFLYPRRGVGVTIVFKIQFIPGEDDLVTVWLNPDLGPGANEASQPDSLTTRFYANASFDEIRLRHGGNGDGWKFSDLAIVTSFSDLVDASSARPNDANSGALSRADAFSFQSWQKVQGLPQSSVRALAQTQDGYLWYGSDDGLVRFDGVRFVSFGFGEGIKCGQVSALSTDDHGALWIGTTGNGLCRWQNNQFASFSTRDGLPDNTITALANDAGDLWVGTRAGLVLWRAGGPVPFSAAERFKGSTVTTLYRDRGGMIWLAVQGAGVFQFTNHTFVPVTDAAVADLLKDCHCLLVDRGGRLWAGSGADFVLCHDGDRWRRYRLPHNRAGSPICTLAEETPGVVWAGAGVGGLVQFKDSKSRAIPTAAGLAGNAVESLFADSDGGLWVGTDTALNRLNRKNLFALSQSEGLGFGAAQSLAEVTPGVVWVGKPNDGLYRWDGKSFSRLSVTGWSPHGSQITTLLVTPSGFCWVATTKDLLLYKDPIAASDEVKTIESSPPNITALAEDRESGLWVGTRTGKIQRLIDNHWQEPGNLSQPNAITALVPAPDGSLWVGTDGHGLYRFANGAIQHSGIPEGLASAAIRTLYLDADNTLWIGTGDAGLSRWRAGHFVNFTVPEGLPDRTISEILEDDAGRLWLGTGRGIACVSKRRLDELAAGEISTVYPRLFGQADGMLSEECAGGFFPAGLATKSGQLWFPTSKGVVIIDPHGEPTATPPPKTVLEQVLVDGQPQPFDRDLPAGALRVTPGKHRVEFRYTGLSFDAPDLIRFRYQLEGLDADWVDAGTRRSAFYSYLPPGDYKFHLTACNRDGIWSESGPALEMMVMRHFWQAWWFAGLVGFSLLAAVGGLVRAVVKRNLQRRLKHLEQERTLERERTRIAQDLHDEMGAKLCRISFLSEHARRGELPPAEMQTQIDSISNASRDVLRSLDEIVWAVNPQNDTLEHVASYIGQYAQDYFQMTGIECELDIPAQLPPCPLSSHQRHHLFLATQEAFTNILKHSRATQARVLMVLNDDAFEIDISDNGIGFAREALGPPAVSPAAPDGNGLNNMVQRLADIGGGCHVTSAPGRGTQVRFAISLRVLTNHRSIKL